MKIVISIRKLFLIFLANCFLLSSPWTNASSTDPLEIRYTQVGQTNQALVQGHRYLELLNTALSQDDLNNSLAKSKNFLIKGYQHFDTLQAPSDSTNFFINSFDYHIVNSEQSILTLTIDYQDIKPSKNKSGQYKAKIFLRQQPNALPLVEKITQENPHASKIYSEEKYIPGINRVKSLVYYWTFLLDQKNADKAELFGLLEANNYQLKLDRKDIDDPKTLEHWFNNRFSSITKTSRIVDDLKVTKIADKTYRVTFEYDLRGESLTQKTVIGLLKYDWIVIDNGSFLPQIRKIIESYLVPLIDTGTRIRC